MAREDSNSSIERSYVHASDGDRGPRETEFETEGGSITVEAVQCTVCGDVVAVSEAVHIHIDPYEQECPNRLCAETHPYPYEERYLCTEHSAALLDYLPGPDLEHRMVRTVRCDRRFVRACWVTTALIVLTYLLSQVVATLWL